VSDLTTGINEIVGIVEPYFGPIAQPLIVFVVSEFVVSEFETVSESVMVAESSTVRGPLIETSDEVSVIGDDDEPSDTDEFDVMGPYTVSEREVYCEPICVLPKALRGPFICVSLFKIVIPETVSEFESSKNLFALIFEANICNDVGMVMDEEDEALSPKLKFEFVEVSESVCIFIIAKFPSGSEAEDAVIEPKSIVSSCVNVDSSFDSSLCSIETFAFVRMS